MLILAYAFTWQNSTSKTKLILSLQFRTRSSLSFRTELTVQDNSYISCKVMFEAKQLYYGQTSTAAKFSSQSFGLLINTQATLSPLNRKLKYCTAVILHILHSTEISRDTAHGVETCCGLDYWGAGVRVLVGSRIFSTPSKPALGHTQPPI
jgi:hypothetical protein